MKISIITVCYNAASTIERTIKSVLNQNYNDIEYIIIDGGSNDETLNIINNYKDRISIIISEPDKGIYDAMNKGIKIATGELIGIINADDWYESNIIKTIANRFSKSDKQTIFYGDIAMHKGFSSKIYKPKKSLEYLWLANIIAHPTVFIPQFLYNKYGVFNIKYRIAADYDLLLRMYKANIKFEYIPQLITHMSTGGESDKNALLGYNEAFKIALSADIPLHKILYAYLRKIILLFINPIRNNFNFI